MQVYIQCIYAYTIQMHKSLRGLNGGLNPTVVQLLKNR